jgi:excisionase family DNA binding protein
MRNKAATTGSTSPTLGKKADIPVLALRVEQAAESLGIGRTMAYRLIAEGRLRSIKVGSRTIIPVRSIEDYLATNAA